METRRLLTFMIVSTTFILLWSNFLAPKMPQVPPAQQPQARQTPDADQPALDRAPQAAGEDDAPKPELSDLPVHPKQSVTLGSKDPNSSYAIEASVTTEGAAIEAVWLAGIRLKDLEDRGQQVKVLGNNKTDRFRTFNTSIDLIDEQLKPFGQSLETVNWKLEGAEKDLVSFSYAAPDGSLSVLKTYQIEPLSVSATSAEFSRKDQPQSYTIRCELTVRNLTAKEKEVRYEILGPCGVILENAEHTSKYRDIKLEFLKDDGYDSMGAAELQKVYAGRRTSLPGQSNEEVERLVRDSASWSEPFRYAGIDVQFFAALIAPLDHRELPERLEDRWIEKTWPVLIEESVQERHLSDISFRMQSTPRVLRPAGTAEDVLRHDFALFVGPKRDTLLDPPPFKAERVLDYGSWFGFIARGMHTVLNFLYDMGMPYWLAIISLTAMVRGCLFPLSRKQALSAARMKELTPKINELKLKYGDDKEKLAKAQMELWRKHNINPLGGCLPLFFQLPVFIGLYTCLNTALDLRLSRFLWIDNLAAPDALFRMPFSLPFLGHDFNLLPCINVVLFLVQQKLFMPPPADEQAEMQQKMMNYMTIVFAAMFWHVPAGLCIYFVASSLWSIAERKLLGSNVLGTSTPTDDPSDPSGVDSTPAQAKRKPNRPATTNQKEDTNRPKGFFERLMAAAEDAKQQAEKSKGASVRKPDRKAGKKGRG